MDPAVVAALVGAGGVVAGATVSSLFSRRLQNAQADAIRQDIYQQLTADLRAELERVRTELQTARQSLADTSAEAERLRLRVLELESRVAQFAQIEQQLAAELAAARAERDRARAELVDREKTIAYLRGRVDELQQRLRLQPDAQ